MKTIRKDWATCMSMIEYLFRFGYTVYMSNHKRWGVMMNDKREFFKTSNGDLFPDLEEDFRGNKHTPEQSNLEDCCDLLNHILEELKDIEGTKFVYLFDDKLYKFTLNQFTNENNKRMV
jgi:hypothetical protein